MDKDFIDIYNKVSNEKYNEETKNDLNFNIEIKISEEDKEGETNFEKWMKKYKLAESYYEHYGNLEIPFNFKTTNGYEYDEEGIKLGNWINTQRQAYKGQGKNKLTEEQIKLLEKIGMHFDNVNFEKWMKKYNLAESYYNHHGHLNIPRNFKTTNGYEYNEQGVKLGFWINTQRQAYRGYGTCKLTEEQIKLLEKIEIKWFNNNTDQKLQNEIINEQNKNKKKIEILNRVKSYLNTLDENRVYSKEELNSGFVKKLKTDKESIDIYNKVSNEKYNTETKNGLTFNDKIKISEEDKKGETNFEKWMKKYKLAKAYYEHHGNLEIPQNFKTEYGYEYNEQGVELGIWMQNQRMAYKGQGDYKLTEEQKRLLEKLIIGFGDVNFEEWMKNYILAKAYYIYNGNLNIPQSFKTTNGYKYDEEGINLGNWISTQRRAYKGQGDYKLTEEQKKLLEKIGMVPDVYSDNWMKKYKLAESYYNHHGHLNIPQNFKTKYGYEYNEQGVELGIWMQNQRIAYKGQGTNKLTEEQKKLLEKLVIGFGDVNFKKWMKKYKLAEFYYEHHGNLNIPQWFKTTNGYKYDEEGINLGNWIRKQRQAYKGYGTSKLTEEQKRLLEKLVIGFGDVNFEKWMKKYKLAESYHKHHGNLNIPCSFKTTNGYEYNEQGVELGSWINTQRQAYKGQGIKKLTEQQIKLLEKIEIKWFNNNTDQKLQNEIINEQNKNKKKIEILNRVKSYLNTLDENRVYSKEELNSGFVKKLKTDKESIDIYNKVSNEKYNTETKNGLTFNDKIKISEEDKKGETNFEKWMKKYKLAESYYEHHGNLEIPVKFKTTNGYEYDEQGVKLVFWIDTQRQAYKGQGKNKLTEEQIKLLEKIGIDWFKYSVDLKLQSEIINEQNKTKKQIEILNRVKSYLNTLDENKVYSKEEINSGFVKKLSK